MNPGEIFESSFSPEHYQKTLVYELKTMRSFSVLCVLILALASASRYSVLYDLKEKTYVVLWGSQK